MKKAVIYDSIKARNMSPIRMQDERYYGFNSKKSETSQLSKSTLHGRDNSIEKIMIEKLKFKQQNSGTIDP